MAPYYCCHHAMQINFSMFDFHDKALDGPIVYLYIYVSKIFMQLCPNLIYPFFVVNTCYRQVICVCVCVCCHANVGRVGRLHMI